MTTLLSNIRVIELGRAVAAPWVGQTLADLGAEVIKVEALEGGDFTRQLGPSYIPDGDGRPTSDGAVFAGLNRTKKSIAVDLSKPEGADMVRRLGAISDVFIENFKPGDLSRRGLDYPALSADSPSLIYISISGFGQSGPYRSRPGMDGIVQGMCGFMYLQGHAGGPPATSTMPVMDFFTGMNGVVAVLAALYGRDARGGQGQYIDLALFDSALAMMSYRITEHLISGVDPERGQPDDGISPAGVFKLQGGAEVQILIRSDAEFARLCEQLERPELAKDPRFSTAAARTANREAVTCATAKLVAQLSPATAFERLERGGILHSPISRLSEVIRHPQVEARKLIGQSPHAQGGSVDFVRNPIRFSRTPVERYHAPPVLGAHTDEILSSLLGISSEQLRELREQRVVG